MISYPVVLHSGKKSECLVALGLSQSPGTIISLSAILHHV